MPALLFPSDDVLRLALAAGVIPPAVAAGPVSAGIDDAGRVWAEAAPEVVRDGLAALQRLGARLHGSAGQPQRVYHSWHQLLPLRPTPAGPTPGPVLIDLPDDRLARFAARVLRHAPQPVELDFLPRPEGPGRCRIRLQTLPPLLTVGDWLAEPSRVYDGIAPGVWARRGWAHPLADQIRPPDGAAVLLDPDREWTVVPADTPYRSSAEYRVGSRVTAVPEYDPAAPTVGVLLTLRPRREAGRDEFWVLPGDGEEAFRAYLLEADERTLRGCRVAVLAAGSHRRVVLRGARDGEGPLAAWAGRAFTTHPGLPRLLVPATLALRPTARRNRVAAAFGVSDHGLVWLDPASAGGYHTNRADAVRFRPASDLVEYHAPPVTRLAAAWGVDTPFAFEPIGPVVGPGPLPADPEPRPPRAGDGWLTRSLDRIAKKLRGPRPAPTDRPSRPAATPAVAAGDEPEDPGTPDIPAPSDWAARRAELESRVIHDLPGLSGGGRADLWAEVAELAAATGAHADAGLCWANAIWEAENPPPEWFDGWVRAETRLAKLTRPVGDLGEALTLTTRRVPPRLVAAYLAWCGAQPVPPADFPDRLPRLLALLDDRQDKLPLRAAWLARAAAGGLADGDPLGLARWRDAVFRRLADVGPTLDLDAPGFVRFHGRPGGDRFLAARDWLLRMREPAQRWLARQASPRRLEWFGLDPETDATAGYIDLMFAWGASRLGERNTGRDWEEAAAGVLGRPPGAGDAGVHAVLLAAFRHRIREAQQGRPERPGLPADVLPAYGQLSDFQRYVVDRLRRASGILEPVDRVNPYRGRDAVEFLGGDPLGRRLRRLGELQSGDDLDREVRAVLALAAADPAPAVLPRVVLAAVSAAPRLPADTALEVLGAVPAAVRLTPEWFWAARGQPTGQGGRLEDVLSRFLDATARAAPAFDAPDVLRDLARYLTEPTAPPAPVPQAALGPVAGRFFRALRRCGLRSEAEALLERAAPPGPATADDLVHRVGFAVGWLAVGNEAAATRLLDEARARLFAVGSLPPRPRSQLAVGYAAALGHAPPRLALGRLEEIIQRLDGVHAPGSANRYFTPAVLELVDVIVRSVVSDDFALGPEVRGWLDDHEFGTRRRISRDLDAVLAAAGLTAAGAPPDVPGRGRRG